VTDDEMQLWRRFKRTAETRDRERLILTYAPLVKYVVGRLSSGVRTHVEDADLLSYGLLGLISAIERYDPERDVKFEAYAITRIRGTIFDGLRTLDWVPRSVRRRAREIENAIATLEATLERTPTDEEIAEKVGISQDELDASLAEISRSTIGALDEIWAGNDGEPVSLLDMIEDTSFLHPSETFDEPDLRDTVADALARLPERERLVITLYYYEELNLREIGEVLGVTESRVSQMHSKAMLRLRARFAHEIGIATADAGADN